MSPTTPPYRTPMSVNSCGGFLCLKHIKPIIVLTSSVKEFYTIKSPCRQRWVTNASGANLLKRITIVLAIDELEIVTCDPYPVNDCQYVMQSIQG